LQKRIKRNNSKNKEKFSAGKYFTNTVIFAKVSFYLEIKILIC